jgi:hypothetical protein
MSYFLSFHIESAANLRQIVQTCKFFGDFFIKNLKKMHFIATISRFLLQITVFFVVSGDVNRIGSIATPYLYI